MGSGSVAPVPEPPRRPTFLPLAHTTKHSDGQAGPAKHDLALSGQLESGAPTQLYPDGSPVENGGVRYRDGSVYRFA